MSLRERHNPSLDGLRALAVLAVLAYHLHVRFVRGGYLGVDLFFVLSGFLITSLLLEERLETGRVALVAFWRRRARRLLPALFAMLIVVTVAPWFVTRFISPTALAAFDLTALRHQALASWFYVANWFAVSNGHSYFTHLALPSPLNHTWSLAIEEQFYVLWPLVTLLLVGRKGFVRRRGVWATLGLAVASLAAMAVLFHGDASSLNFVYNATFTRLFDLGFGAALAWVVVRRSAVEALPSVTAPLALGATAGWLLLVVVAGQADETPFSWMLRGGFLLAAVLATTMVAGTLVPGPLARLLALRPLTLVGRVSYGLYLWHWPVITYLSTSSTGVFGLRLLGLRLVVIAALTALSFVLLEQPIRQQRWSLSWRRLASLGGVIASLASILVFTAGWMFPTPDVRAELAAYAQSGVPVGANVIAGHLDPSWLASQHFGSRHRYHVLILGDSFPYYAQAGLRAAIDASPDLHAQVFSYPGIGLYQAQYTDHLLSAVAWDHPDLVVMMLTYDNGTYAEHRVAYEQRARAFFQRVFALGVHDVAFATVPASAGVVGLSTGGYSTNAILNKRFRAYQARLAASFGAHGLVFEVAPSLERHGHYSAWLPSPNAPDAPRTTWARTRMLDGVHTCPVGTELYAAALAYDLATVAHLRVPSNGWWHGSWPHAKLHIPLGAQWCPNDHPAP